MLSDLPEMTITNAIRAYNRIMIEARLFFRELTAHEDAADSGLVDYSSRKMWTDGTSRTLSQPQEWFVMSTIACYFRHPAGPSDYGAFAAFFLDEQPATLDVGLFWSRTTELTAGFANSERITPDAAADPYLAHADAPELTELTQSGASVWRYATRPWLPEHRDTDVAWTASTLARAASVLAAAPARG